MQRKTLLNVGLSILMIAYACKTGQKEEPQIPVVGVRILRVSCTDYVFPVRTTGKLSAKTESKLSFKTGGIISRILVDEGQSVRKGQLLAELNPEEIRSQVDQTELVLEKAERDYRRTGNLYRDSVATLEQFENTRTALEVARASDRIARFNLQYSSIHAPSNGKILKRIAESDEIIAPGHPVFLFASTLNDWVVRANLTDRDMIRVSMLDSARIFFDAYPEQVFMGMVSEIGTAADPYSGTYEIEIRILRKPEKLVSGFFARIEIFTSDEQEKIIIPFESVLDGAGLTGYVYVLTDGKPRRRSVQIEAFTDRGVILSGGLLAGEEIIIEGSQYLREGSIVEIIETEK